MNPPKGGIVTRELIYAQNVNVIFGPAFTTVNFAILPVIRDAKMLHLSFGTGTAIVNLKKNPYTFRMKYSSRIEAETIVNYVVTAKSHRKVAIFHNSTAYGKAGLAELLPLLKQKGITPITVQSHNVGDKDMTGQLLNIKKSGATAILGWGFTPDFAILAKNMQTLGMNIPVYGSAGLTSYFFKDMVGDAGRNFFGVMIKKFSFNRKNPLPSDAKAFMDELTRRYGLNRKSALDNSSSWYDAVYVYAKAVKLAGSTDKQKVKSAMEQIRHKGISGEIVFTPEDHEALTVKDLTMAYCTGKMPEGSLRRPDDID
jgi:branched-chain amino acid transport system substrate-binding protein